MKFKIGDKVRFLNEKGEGIVSRIINKTTVGVTIEDGFELPFMETELVTIHDGSLPPPAKKEQPSAETPAPVFVSTGSGRKEEQEGIYMALSPENPRDLSYSDFNLWLVNHTEYELLYTASTSAGKGYEAFDTGGAHPHESKLIETIGKKELDRFSTVKIDALFFSEEVFGHQQPVSETVKIRPVKLYKDNTFTENSFIPEKAFIIPVKRLGEELYFDRPEEQRVDLSELLQQKKTAQQSQKISRPHRNNNPVFETEVDIHIEEIAENWSGMSNAEIVQMQLRHFQRALDEAIAGHYRKLTVIHGVGNGRLKQEVRTILSTMNLRFHDGAYAKYGFGATEIILS